ncbi:class I SAM-dependent methyltransferase [Aminobacter sp. AP02]|uniref:class I SAM-dependent methyltransferase n=1 Tax=Aminobacter sp. AP02 TaxID=2135737 RepID=UPI000D6D3EE5|nr:class I SAM-dependent methyltransferase [Aminobacter sp. AP02]PWK72881.1 methyltransferase family protein [Aminobacter sp. AP02]
MGSIENHRMAPGVALAEGPCLVCGGFLGNSALPGLLRCEACGFVTANVSVSDEELERIYGEDYFHGNEYLDYQAEEKSLRQNFRDRIRTLMAKVENFGDSDLFEIGCAYGYFLAEVSADVRRASGIDISADAVAAARDKRNVDAMCGDYLNHELGRTVDVITMWDTIEHLKRPDQFIAKAASDLKPGGHIALTTGDIDSLNAQFRGKNWRMIHPPTHLHYFSVATLTSLLSRHGFEVVHASHPGNSRNLRSILYYIMVLRLKRPKVYEALNASRLFDLRIKINLFDIMFVIARRQA